MQISSSKLEHLKIQIETNFFQIKLINQFQITSILKHHLQESRNVDAHKNLKKK